MLERSGFCTLTLVRCREGATFSDSAQAVRAIFVLAGSKDQRNTHLVSLAAIAQLVQNHDFETRWLEAKGEEMLRSVVLLGGRQRH